MKQEEIIEEIIDVEEQISPQKGTDMKIRSVDKVISRNGNDVLRVTTLREEIPEGFDDGLQPHQDQEYYGDQAASIVQEHGTPEQYEMASTISEECREAYTLKRLRLSVEQLRGMKIYRKHTIETIHAGHKSSDGGEYGEWETLFILESEGRYFLLKKFGTTSDFEFCDYCGWFQQEGNAHCIGNDTEIMIDGVWVAPSRLVEIPPDVMPLIERGITEEDGTGHEYSCSEQGGCTVCHPYTN